MRNLILEDISDEYAHEELENAWEDWLRREEASFESHSEPYKFVPLFHDLCKSDDEAQKTERASPSAADEMAPHLRYSTGAYGLCSAEPDSLKIPWSLLQKLSPKGSLSWAPVSWGPSLSRLRQKQEKRQMQLLQWEQQQALIEDVEGLSPPTSSPHPPSGQPVLSCITSRSLELTNLSLQAGRLMSWTESQEKLAKKENVSILPPPPKDERRLSLSHLPGTIPKAEEQPYPGSNANAMKLQLSSYPLSSAYTHLAAKEPQSIAPIGNSNTSQISLRRLSMDFRSKAPGRSSPSLHRQAYLNGSVLAGESSRESTSLRDQNLQDEEKSEISCESSGSPILPSGGGVGGMIATSTFCELGNRKQQQQHQLLETLLSKHSKSRESNLSTRTSMPDDWGIDIMMTEASELFRSAIADRSAKQVTNPQQQQQQQQQPRRSLNLASALSHRTSISLVRSGSSAARLPSSGQHHSNVTPLIQNIGISRSQHQRFHSIAAAPGNIPGSTPGCGGNGEGSRGVAPAHPMIQQQQQQLQQDVQSKRGLGMMTGPFQNAAGIQKLLDQAHCQGGSPAPYKSTQALVRSLSTGHPMGQTFGHLSNRPRAGSAMASGSTPRMAQQALYNQVSQNQVQGIKEPNVSQAVLKNYTPTPSSNLSQMTIKSSTSNTSTSDTIGQPPPLPLPLLLEGSLKGSGQVISGGKAQSHANLRKGLQFGLREVLKGYQ